MNRERLLVFVLIAVTVMAVYLCYRLISPFLPAVTWALALAILGTPLHRRILRRFGGRPNVAAGVSVAVLVVLLIGPIALVGNVVAAQVMEVVDRAQSINWNALPLVRWVHEHVMVEQEITDLVDQWKERAGSMVKGTIWGITQALVAGFLLFYMFRDRADALAVFRALVPLSSNETDQVVERVKGMVRATVWGTLVVGVIQGGLGGLIFFVLGLPGALLWGLVMALLSIIPLLGAFLVWGPAAIYLIVEGQWVKASILIAWGMIVVGLIDNLLYPILVGRDVHLHTVPVFLAIIGGLVVFGASGIILGPVILTVTLALLEIWQRRTAAREAT